MRGLVFLWLALASLTCDAGATPVSGEETPADARTEPSRRLLFANARPRPPARLRLVSWNVANFNPPPGTTAEESLALSTRLVKAELMAVSALFGGEPPDVITLNEDIEFNATAGANALNLGPEYANAGSCRAEALWTSEPAYANGGRFLQNSMWVRSSTWELADAPVSKATVTATVSKATTASGGEVYPRCAVVALLRPGGGARLGIEPPVLSVASVHLTGGKFTDVNWADFAGEKAHEAWQTIRLGEAAFGSWPDVVMGDFNSYVNDTIVRQHQAGYEPYTTAVANGEEEGYLGWSLEGVTAMKSAGYARLPIDEDTTKWGGAVDHIFIKGGSAVRAVGSLGAVPGFKYSDHAIIYAETELAYK